MLPFPNTYFYAVILLITLIGPLSFSFDKRVHYYTYFNYTFLSSLVVATPFIFFDMLYTYYSVWGFNDLYHLPFYIFNLPVEEFLFFFIVPFSCNFIYLNVCKYFSKIQLPKLNSLLILGAIVCFLLAFMFYNKSYTCFTFLSTALLLLYLKVQKANFTNFVILSYILSCIPFILINGVLTGMLTQNPVVWYNSNEIIGIRCITIPIEDFSYSFNLLVLNFISLEYFKSK